MSALRTLADAWREEAQRLRERYGHDGLARLCETHASELLEAVEAHADEELDLATAARESGYAERTLRQKVAEGEIPNAGRKGRPRIRRGDLPRRGGGADDDFDADAHVVSILGRRS